MVTGAADDVGASGWPSVASETTGAAEDVGASGWPSVASETTGAEVVTGAADEVGASGWPSLAAEPTGEFDRHCNACQLDVRTGFGEGLFTDMIWVTA